MAAPDIFAGTCIVRLYVPRILKNIIVFLARRALWKVPSISWSSWIYRRDRRARIVSRIYSHLILSPCELQVLLVTSSRRPDSWIVPGGGVEPEEEPSVTALREVREEAGVLGQLGRCLGTFEVITRDVCHTNRYYVMLH